MDQEGHGEVVLGVIPGAAEALASTSRPQVWKSTAGSVLLAENLTPRPMINPEMSPDARLLLPGGWADILGASKLFCQQAAPSAAFC